jgi:hypothetical protein
MNNLYLFSLYLKALKWFIARLVSRNEIEINYKELKYYLVNF